MLQIREAQLKVFKQAALKNFEDEMVVHSREFSPPLCQALGEERLRVALRQAMSRAGDFGFTLRGPLRLFIEMMFLFGSAFDSDPQYPWALKILRSAGDQMQRAQSLCDEIMNYNKEVSGPEDVHTQRALARFGALAQKPLTFSTAEFAAGLSQEMRRAFPQKAARVGDAALMALLRKAGFEARKRSLPLRGEALLAILMFGFGHSCPDDPLYPWIASTLNDDRIVDPTARAERLEKKALNWLDLVLAGPKEGAPA